MPGLRKRPGRPTNVERDARARVAMEQQVRDLVNQELATRELELRAEFARELSRRELELREGLSRELSERMNDHRGIDPRDVQDDDNDVPQPLGTDARGEVEDASSGSGVAAEGADVGSCQPQTVNLVSNASLDVIAGILRIHGASVPPILAVAMERLRQITRTLAAMLGSPIEFDSLTVMEAQILNSPSWMRKLRKKGLTEDELNRLVSQAGIVTNDDIAALSIQQIDELNLRVATKGKLLAIRNGMQRRSGSITDLTVESSPSISSSGSGRDEFWRSARDSPRARSIHDGSASVAGSRRPVRRSDRQDRRPPRSRTERQVGRGRRSGGSDSSSDYLPARSVFDYSGQPNVRPVTRLGVRNKLPPDNGEAAHHEQPVVENEVVEEPPGSNTGQAHQELASASPNKAHNSLTYTIKLNHIKGGPFEWLNSVKWNLATYPLTDEEKILVVRRHVTGDLQEAAVHADKLGPMTFDRYIEAMQKKITTTPKFYLLENEIFTMQYTFAEEPEEFIRRLKSKIKQRHGWETVDESYLLSLLKGKVPEEVRKEAQRRGADLTESEFTSVMVHHYTDHREKALAKRKELPPSQRQDGKGKYRSADGRNQEKRDDGKSTQASRQARPNKESDVCYHCKEKGHIKPRCPKLLSELNSAESRSSSASLKPKIVIDDPQPKIEWKGALIISDSGEFSSRKSKKKSKKGEKDGKQVKATVVPTSSGGITPREKDIKSLSIQPIFAEVKEEFEDSDQSPEIVAMYRRLRKINSATPKRFPKCLVNVYTKTGEYSIAASCDSCSNISIIDRDLCRRFGWKPIGNSTPLHGLEGTGTNSLGSIFVLTKTGESNLGYSHELFVLPNFGPGMLLGCQILSLYEVDIRLRVTGHQVLYSPKQTSLALDMKACNDEELRQMTNYDCSLPVDKHETIEESSSSSSESSEQTLDSLDDASEDDHGVKEEDGSDEQLLCLLSEVLPASEVREVLEPDPPSRESWPEVFDRQISHELSDNERQRVMDCLLDKHKAFARDSSELGLIPWQRCNIRIDIGDEIIPYEKPYACSAAKRLAFDQTCRELELAGIISETTAPGGSPALLVPKPDGSFRLVVDYRELNRRIKRKQYPMPRTDDYLSALKNKRFFATLDLLHGYYQIELPPEERLKTVFLTPNKKYVYN